MKATYTYAILDVSAETFREIQLKLEAAGYHHAFHEDAEGSLVIDLHGVAIRDEDDEPLVHEIGEPVAPLEDPAHPTHGRPS